MSSKSRWPEVLPTFTTWNSTNPTAIKREMCSGRLFHILKLQFKKKRRKKRINSAIRFSHVISKQLIKRMCNFCRNKRHHTKNSGRENLEPHNFEWLRSLLKCHDLYKISLSAEGRRMNASQQTTWIRDVNDWLKSNLTWKYSLPLFPHEFNQKLIFASFISASASY